MLFGGEKMTDLFLQVRIRLGSRHVLNNLSGRTDDIEVSACNTSHVHRDNPEKEKPATLTCLCEKINNASCK